MTTKTTLTTTTKATPMPTKASTRKPLSTKPLSKKATPTKPLLTKVNPTKLMSKKITSVKSTPMRTMQTSATRTTSSSTEASAVVCSAGRYQDAGWYRDPGGRDQWSCDSTAFAPELPEAFDDQASDSCNDSDISDVEFVTSSQPINELVGQTAPRNYNKIDAHTRAMLLVYLSYEWHVEDCAVLLLVHKNTLQKFIKRLEDAGELLPVVSTSPPMPGTVKWLLDTKYIHMPPDETLHWADREDLNFQKLLTYLDKMVYTMDICRFVITCAQLGAAVRDAHRCKVVVRVVCDYDQMFKQGSQIMSFVVAGIPVYTMQLSASMHNKFTILDGRIKLNGSFNWSERVRR